VVKGSGFGDFHQGFQVPPFNLDLGLILLSALFLTGSSSLRNEDKGFLYKDGGSSGFIDSSLIPLFPTLVNLKLRMPYFAL